MDTLDGADEDITMPEKPASAKLGLQLSVRAPFAVRIRGIDAAGKSFDSRAVLDTLSGRDCSMQLPWRLIPGSKVFAIIQLALSRPADAAGLRVAVRGIVRRVVPNPAGHYEVDVDFTRHRFLWKQD